MIEGIGPFLELPKGWAWSSLGDITDRIANGITERQSKEKKGIPVSRIETISSGSIDTNKVGYLNNLESDLIEKFSLRKGDILFSHINSDSHLGKTAIFDIDDFILLHGMNLLLIRPNSKVTNSKFLHYLCNYYRNIGYFISIAQHAVNQSSINQSKIRNLMVPLAPPPEQHRIVTRIEELFSRLDAGIAALQGTKAQLRRYRQSVLKAAVEGRLTEEWRKAHPEVEPAEKMLERVDTERQSKIKEKYKKLSFNNIELSQGLKESWMLTTISHVTECLDYKRVPINKKERVKRVGSIPYYGANGQVGWIDDFLFEEPLVLVVEDETFTGREKPFSYKITGKSWVNNHAHVLKATAAVDIDYLNYSLEYYPFTPLTTGTTGRKKLTQLALMSAAYALPPFAEQKEIIKEIELHLSISDQVVKNIETSLRYTNPLRQSILKRAFQGKLVPQNPNDEPAHMLLERIKYERAVHAPKRGRRINHNIAHQMRLVQ